MSKKVGRKKNEITEETKQEAQEILDLAFKDVGCIKSKITYNYVSKFNRWNEKWKIFIGLHIYSIMGN